MTQHDPSSELTFFIGAALVAYLLGMYALSFWTRGKIQSEEDYLVAGRRLPLSLAWATLLATWFGAGSMLTAADQVRAGGLPRAALDPLGAGLCLLLAGLFFARPLWNMGLLTLADFFKKRFGPRAELLSSLIMVPTYFGWVAAQFIALAGMLHLFFGLDPKLGILLVAVIGTSYTFLGGMWSVTLTDAVQIGLVLVGLAVLGHATLINLGGDAGALAGLARLGADTPAPLLALIPTGSGNELVGWVGILAIGALGNIPGQDLTQRLFAAKSAKVAERACYVAGGLYLAFGAIPVLIGLSARLLAPEIQTPAILPALAAAFLSPAMTVVFILALTSAVLSTITSAILSPASVLAQNLLPRLTGSRYRALTLNRAAVLGVTAGSLLMAYAGESAYSLLEDAYALPLVALFVPLTLGIYGKKLSERAAVASMLSGATLWLGHYVLGWEHFLGPVAALFGLELPLGLFAAGVSLAAYLGADRSAARAPVIALEAAPSTDAAQ